MGRRNRAFKLPVVKKPQVDQKRDEPEGSKIRKSKNSPAGPSHGAKVKELKISATSAYEGAKTVETKIAATSPHEERETVAVHSLKYCIIEDVYCKGVDCSDFMDSLFGGSRNEESLPSDDDAGSGDEESLPSDNVADCYVLDPILYYQEL